MEKEPTPETREQKRILYTAFFVNDVQALLTHFPPKHALTYGHHSTITYRPSNVDEQSLGAQSTLRIIGRVSDDMGDALLVENPQSTKAHPHITLSCATDEHGTPLVSPKYSDEMIERAYANNTVHLYEHPVEVAVTQGYFDGKVVTSKTT